MRLPPITANVDGLVGTSVWDLFGGEEVLRPAAEAVLASRRPAGMRIFFDGVVQDLHAEPHGRFLRIRYRIVRTIDVQTLESLLASTTAMAADLARPFGSEPVATP
ncbi:MAG: hypothetical protein ACKOKE_06010 [Actinomycetota bacterium]